MKSRFSPYIAALTAFLAVGISVWVVDYAEQKRFQQQTQAEVLNQVSAVRGKLEAGLNSRLFLARGLVAYIRLNPDISQTEFNRLAEIILAQQTGIRHLSLAKNTTVTYIYPLAGNEVAIGLDMSKIPEQWKSVRRAIETRQTIVGGARLFNSR